MSGDVPQANAIGRVIDLVRAIARGERLTAFAHQRDRAFYSKAARILGLMEEKKLTERGRGLARLDGPPLISALRSAFEESRVGAAWLKWAGASSLDELDATTAPRFLFERSNIAPSTQQRRASTLTRWARQLQAAASGQIALRPLRQIGLFEAREWRRWPDSRRFPHNENPQRVGNVLAADFAESSDWLIETGYSSLPSLLRQLSSGVERCDRIRLLLGTEPFAAASSPSRTARRPLPAEIRDYWLKRGISVLQGAEVLSVAQAVLAGLIDVRTAPRQRPIHAKVYLTGSAITLGSSNFTPSGLGRQSEANVRFDAADEPRYREGKDLAEGLWTLGEDYKEGFLALLKELLQTVTWQEALARGCAAILEGEWAREYLSHELLGELESPLWPHQFQGIAQAMWVLENVGAVLVADAAGSGKTRMGAWLFRAAFDRQYRFGFTVRPSPLVISPPAVVEDWKRRLDETSLPFQVDSHGPLSNTRSRRHRELLRHIGETELLVVDEAHNFLNPSARTFRLVSHYAENVLLFTATPINRSAADLLALVDLLGADNLSDASRATLNRLRRRTTSAPEAADLQIMRKEIRRFTVRRTRAQLNEIADRHPEGYQLPSRRNARYPHHRAEYYDAGCRASDVRIAHEIAQTADQLKGISRIPKVIEVPAFWQGTEDGFVERIRASARALARYHVMNSLRSSRVALYEHVRGTEAAAAKYLQPTHRSKKSETGDMAARAKRLAGRVPQWKLSESARAGAPSWLLDASAHQEACLEELRLYERIAELVEGLSSDREERKLALLERLGAERMVVGFDAHVITLTLFHTELLARGIDAGLFTGEGGAAAKRQALDQLGLTSAAERYVALCSDAFSEGMNLQKASAVVHLDTPTVIRLAEQRAGRVDRMDSPHSEVGIWWPRDPPTFAPRRRDLLRERHELVADLIGANLHLPEDDASVVRVEDLAAQADIEHAAEEMTHSHPKELYDAFRGVRRLIEPGGLVTPDEYEAIRTSRVRIQSSVSTVSSERPWAFLVVGGVQRRAPQWVFFDAVDSDPICDLSAVSDALVERLGPTVRDLPTTQEVVELQRRFVERLRDCEDLLLPPRRRRALGLLRSVLSEWAESELVSSEERARYADLSDWLFPLTEARRQPYADPRGIADAWLALIRPRIRNVLKTVKRRRRFWTLDALRDDLEIQPISPDTLQATFTAVPDLEPVEQRIVAMIVGVPGEGPHGRPLTSG